MSTQSLRKRKQCSKTGCSLAKINSGDVTATCDRCLNIYHIGCADLEESISKLLCENKTKGCMWFCINCRQLVTESFALQTSFTNDLKVEINALKVSFETQLKNIEEKFICKVDTQSSSIDKNIKTYSDAVSKKSPKK